MAMVSANAQPVAEEARRLVAMGYRLLPLGGKVPIKDPQLGFNNGFKDATNDLDRLLEALRKYPRANLGIAIPPGLLVLDLDNADALAPLLSHYPELNHVPRAQTGSGGWHLWVSAPSNIVSRARALPQYALDLRTGGRSYIVAPPSVHPKTGRRYRWIIPLTAPSAVPVIPNRLMGALEKHTTTLKGLPPGTPPPKRQPPPDDERLARRQRAYALKELDTRSGKMENSPEGHRHNDLVTHAVALVGWYRAGALEEDEIVRGLVSAAIKSGLPEHEARYTVAWVFKNSAIPPRTLPEASE